MREVVHTGMPLSRAQRLTLVVLFLFVAAEVFGGALRYGFAQAGAAWLIYVPKLLIALVVLGTLMGALYRNRIRSTVAASLLVLLLFGLVGVYYTQNVLQPAFGIFVLFPMMLALLAEPALTRFGPRLLPYVTGLWLGAAAGVIYDFYAETPWTGFEYELGGAAVSSSREWWTYGVERVAGFSRASYEVAGHLLFLALPIVLLRRGWFLKSLLWIATGALIALTTTKKTLGVYAILTLLLPILSLHLTRRNFKRVVVTSLPWVVAMIGIALPVSTLFVDYSLDLGSEVSLFLFASFEDRLTWMWPDGLELVFQHGSPIFGRGIGGIGAAQTYFEPALSNSADSLYLYLYAVFGIVALPIIGHYTLNVARVDASRSSWSRLMWFWAIAVLMNGWATNGIEGAFTSILLGITFAYVVRNRPGMSAAAKPRHVNRVARHEQEIGRLDSGTVTAATTR